MILDELDGVLFRRAGHRDGPGVGEKPVQCVEAFAQRSFHVINGVNESRVELELSASDDAHAPRLAHPGFVVPVDIGAHGEL